MQDLHTGGAVAQLESMLAHLPAKRIAAHSAEIEQLRPLLDKVHGACSLQS
jgi:hypothetical protein